MSTAERESFHFGMISDRGYQYEARGISKSFSGVQVLQDASVTFAPGEVHSLLGANGAGKSTLLKVMAGTYTADAGELVLDGRVLPPLSPARGQQEGIYLVPQEPRVLPDLSIAENIFLGTLPRARAPLTVNWSVMNEHAAVLLDTVGVKVDPRRPAGELPLALQQLLECARALAHRCGVIFFDEPTSPLTSGEVEGLFGLVDQLRSRGLSLGFISHRMDEVEQISDRITVLRDGAIVARETRGSATRAELTDAMVGRAVLMSKRVPRPTTTDTTVLAVTDLVSEPKVHGISVEVRAGEIVGLAGLVGSGRTEFCEAVFGLRPVESGAVEVAGKNISGTSTRARVASGLVYLAEDRGRNGIFAEVDLVRNCTSAVLERLPSRGGLLKRVDERVRAYQSLVRTTVRAASPDLPIKSLSGGNQQKVLFARWIMAAPKVALFDEPTRGVDVGAKQGIYEIIESLADDGVAVLIVSSELEELVRLCDRVYAVYEGKVVGELAGDDIALESIGRLAVGA